MPKDRCAKLVASYSERLEAVTAVNTFFTLPLWGVVRSIFRRQKMNLLHFGIRL